MSDEYFAQAERAIRAGIAAGETPARWTMTSALYQNLRYFNEDRDWHRHAERAQYGHEQPVTLYGCPVDIKPGAHHSWELRTESGQNWNEHGPLVYSVGTQKVARATISPSHGATREQG